MCGITLPSYEGLSFTTLNGNPLHIFYFLYYFYYYLFLLLFIFIIIYFYYYLFLFIGLKERVRYDSFCIVK